MKLKLDLQVILLKIRMHILKRTEKGYDTYDKQFVSYTKNYAKSKRSSKVNLRLTGHMLNDLQVHENDTLGLTDPYAIAKAKGNSKNGRLFMGNITKELLIIIKKLLLVQVTKQLGKEIKKWKVH